ncbi:MAG: hypothetical protein M3R16_12795, partial [Pseudomonadota bacterium]|nr:hypothetical protein [Pseudomonadota bacterium]
MATCYVEDFLDGNSLATLETSAGCARTGSPCKCDDPISAGGSVKQEGIDILDVDGNRGSPDSEFFPRQPFDDDGNALDDSMFEFLFGVDVENEVLKPATAIAGTR